MVASFAEYGSLGERASLPTALQEFIYFSHVVVVVVVVVVGAQHLLPPSPSPSPSQPFRRDVLRHCDDVRARSPFTLCHFAVKIWGRGREGRSRLRESVTTVTLSQPRPDFFFVEPIPRRTEKPACLKLKQALTKIGFQTSENWVDRNIRILPSASAECVTFCLHPTSYLHTSSAQHLRG